MVYGFNDDKSMADIEQLIANALVVADLSASVTLDSKVSGYSGATPVKLLKMGSVCMLVFKLKATQATWDLLNLPSGARPSVGMTVPFFYSDGATTTTYTCGRLQVMTGGNLVSATEEIKANSYIFGYLTYIVD